MVVQQWEDELLVYSYTALISASTELM